MASVTKKEGPEKMSKKQFSRTVFARLTSSLADFNLKEKKLENRLKKVSKQLAADIIRNKKTNGKKQESTNKEQGTDEKVKHISNKQKKAKENKVAAAE